MEINKTSVLPKDKWRITFSPIIKLLLAIVLLCSSPFLLINAFKFINSETTTITPSYSDCIKSISANQAIKISAHREKSIFGKGSKVFIFWVTTDKGKSWKEFMRFFPDSPPKTPDCENIKFLDNKNYWVWESWQLGITHDGGNSWLVWDAKVSFPNRECCNFHLIEDVQFENANTGFMTLDFDFDGESFTIVKTRDGGKTWK